MASLYLLIVIFLLFLAIFDLFVGVSNDAVNFMQSAVGARAASFRTVIIIASAGVIVGALMSSGMMDVARHGIMLPANYSFEEVMTIFLAVMVTDIIVLDIFNTLGMPTSTTVSLIFDLLGGTFALATVKTINDPSLTYSALLNSENALQVIIAIFVSVAFAFVAGSIIMWVSRLVFTFNYKEHSKYSIAVFGGIAFTSLAYFIFLKGFGSSPYIEESTRLWVIQNTSLLLLIIFVISTVLMEALHLMRINIFKIVVLMGTFALAMAFAGNDLVNFIGVPLAGLDSFQDYMANSNGASPSAFLMTSLTASAKTPPFYLLIAGLIMIVAMATSEKARNVIKTSVDLSRQDGGDEMFGSSAAARSIVRVCQNFSDDVSAVTPPFIKQWIGKRFQKDENVPANDAAAFDLVRAAVTLVISAMLITLGTNYHLPLSTTYVTFMVAMGASLADKAWSRESAVFRVTGVISVIGGWFVTAGVAFLVCAIVCLLMFFGGMFAKLGFIALVALVLIRSNRSYKKKKQQSRREDDTFNLMMKTHDPELIWDMLQRRVRRTQGFVCHFTLAEFNRIMDGLENNSTSDLRNAAKDLKEERQQLKRLRRQELMALRRVPYDIAIERNTWFHLGANSNQQLLYTLQRMLEPIKEHVDNSFTPLSPALCEEFQPMRRAINDLMKATADDIDTNKYDNYREILAQADACKDELSVLRKQHIDRMQAHTDASQLQIDLLYLNVLQESQQLLSNMRHQLRAAKKFMEN